jgi:drug/metabolite transporter (DMT)-like permease
VRPMRGRWIGISLMVIQQACFAVENTAIHRLGSTLSVMQLSALRAIGGLVLAACLLPLIGRSAFHTEHAWLHIVRSLASVGYTFVLVYSLTAMPLADAAALSYTSAIYIVLLAPLLLDEPATARGWSAVSIGLVGALCLIRPRFSGVSPIYIGVLAGTSLNALALVLTRYAQRRDRPVTVMLYVNIIMFIAFSPAALEPLPQLSPTSVLWTLPIAILGPIGMFTGILALKYTEASVLAPYTYTRLIAISAIAPAMFNEMPNTGTVAGSLLIVIACVLSSGHSPRIGGVFDRRLPQPPTSRIS